jgi:hypothetical protein
LRAPDIRKPSTVDDHVVEKALAKSRQIGVHGRGAATKAQQAPVEHRHDERVAIWHVSQAGDTVAERMTGDQGSRLVVADDAVRMDVGYPQTVVVPARGLGKDEIVDKQFEARY